MFDKIDRILKNSRRSAGVWLFALSLVVYLLTLSRTAAPGESARLMVQHLGLDPFPPMSHPLYFLAVRLLGVIPIFDIALRLNFFSALCGAGAVWLLYGIVSRIPHNRTAEEVESRFPADAPATISGLVAGLYLALCVPFWIVSTRAHTAAFDVFLLLLSVRLLMSFQETGKSSHLNAFVLLYGLATTEFATFIVLAPFMAFVLALAMWRTKTLTAGTVTRCVLLYVLGLSVYFIHAWLYRLHPAYEWRAFNSYFMVLWFIWREQYRTIMFSMPQIGWLMVLLVSVIPWMIVVGSPKRAMTRSTVYGSQFLHALLSILSVLVMFNIPIAPWPLLHFRPLLVTPYVIMACWTGYLVGYWYIILAQRSRFDARSASILRGVGRALLIPMLLVLFAASAVLNVKAADGRTGRALTDFADAVVERLGGRTWLLSNGVLDDLIVLSAHEQNVPVHVINMGQGLGAYLRYVASLLDDTRLRGLAQVGMIPLVSEWMSRPGVENELAVLAASDLWFGGNKVPIPAEVLFLGAPSATLPDPEAALSQHEKFWNTCGAELKASAASDSAVSDWSRWALGHISKVANNLGVALEDSGRNDLAFEAYHQARELDTNNVSALLNMVSVAQRDSRPELEELKTEFDDFSGRLRSRLRIWSLAQTYGYVRNPEAFVNRGWAWAMSGKPNMAISEMQRAVAMGANKELASLAMASFYLMQGMKDEPGDLYGKVLEDNPENPTALVGLLDVAMRKGDFDSARATIAKLKEIGAPTALIRLREAMVEVLSGDIAAGKATLQKLVEEDPKNLSAWTLLAAVASEDNDEKTVNRCLSVLTPAATESPQILLTLSQLALAQRDFDGARKHLDNVLRIQPNNRTALEWLLQLDVTQGVRQKAEEHVERLLTLDPHNALANYILGSIQFSRQEYELAESSYRASLQKQRSADALNDLAWLLLLKGRYEESLALAREAVVVNDRHMAAWDTLGMVLLKLEKADEAQAAIQKALSFRPEDPQFNLHMAQVYEKRGMKEEALRLADPLLARPGQLRPESYDELRNLVKRLRGGA
ncbi:MAG TPA: tetratricopeptide repeat protein [Kiritimatiellia bacterium]|nr:tetratricopeptide repeat protein [Kiritimatiellia bacterium]